MNMQTATHEFLEQLGTQPADLPDATVKVVKDDDGDRKSVV